MRSRLFLQEKEGFVRHRGRGALFILPAVAALLALGGASLVCGAAPAATAAAAATRKPAAGDDGWPKTIRMGKAATISLDAPQAESLEGTKLKARGTLRVQRGGRPSRRQARPGMRPT
jgi:hypothetical protein